MTFCSREEALTLLEKNNGNIFLEIGYNQHQEVVDIFEEFNFKFIDSAKDLSGIIRVLEFEKI
jgi:methylase of polypeptide subunit release factors